MDIKIEKLKDIIRNSNNIVFFGGAGVSTESGIPDFRSKDGLYNGNYEFPPEEILSHTFFLLHPKEFFQFYKEKMSVLSFLPNITHKKLAEWEKAGKLKAVITQNIDGLHQKAGSKNVLELHGSILKNYCMDCHKSYDSHVVFKSESIPKCSCGGIIKPDVVLYEEALDEEVVNRAIHYIEEADTLIVAGTSLNVYPANGLLQYFRGKHLILINKEKTNFDNKADLVIHDKLGTIFKSL